MKKATKNMYLPLLCALKNNPFWVVKHLINQLQPESEDIELESI